MSSDRGAIRTRWFVPRRYVVRGGLLALLTLPIGAAWYWWRTQPPPVPSGVRRTLFRGVTYTRDVRRVPRPQVIHVVEIDLTAPGISLLVTPGEPNRKLPLQARTTSQFLQEFGAQVAINGDYFSPWHSTTPWSYYPHVGDPVTVDGFACSRGVMYSKGSSKSPTLYLSKDNRARIGEPIGPVYNAISGNRMLIRNGEFQVVYSVWIDDSELHPRTAVGVDRSGRKLILMVVDGRQSSYSQGVTMAELRSIAAQYGSYSAIALDGGGSATLVVEDELGKPVILNSPIDKRFPGHERPVANHLGVFASRITNAGD